jgi:isoleucyl-tRNA synthetase
MMLRDNVLRSLESLRQQQTIASNQEAAVTISTDDKELIAALNSLGIEQFAALCIVSTITLKIGEGGEEVTAAKSTYAKCQRCWNYWPSVGTDPNHPDLCTRCIDVVNP